MTEEDAFARAVRSSIEGIDQSSSFLFLWEQENHPIALAQLGYAVRKGLPFICLAPYGAELTPKLRAVSDRIVRYDPANPDGCQERLQRAIKSLGLDVP